MEHKFAFVFVLMCFVYFNDAADIRLKRGYNTGEYASERGGYFDDASVSREHGRPCSDGDSYESRDISYERDGYDSNRGHYGTRLR